MNMLIRSILLITCLILLSSCAATTAKKLPEQKNQAMVAYEQGRYREAADIFTRLVEDIPKDADLWFRLGNARAHSGQPQLAIEAYENALLRNPELSKAWFNMGTIYLQQALKAFIDIQQHVGPDDEVGKRAEKIREELLQLMQGDNAGQKTNS